MAVTTEDLREYLGAPADSTESLDRYIKAAEAKFSAAGVPQFLNNALYDHAVLEMAAFYYDHRGLAMSGSYQATAEETARRMVNAFVLELRYAKDGDAT